MKKKNKPGAGRPAKTIDWNLVDKLCQIQCLAIEIADFFLIDVKTLHNKCIKEKGINFSHYYAQKKGEGKISLRRYLWQAVSSGDPRFQATMIFLAKNILGMSDMQTIEHRGKIELESVPDKTLEKIAKMEIEKEAHPRAKIVEARKKKIASSDWEADNINYTSYVSPTGKTGESSDKWPYHHTCAGI